MKQLRLSFASLAATLSTTLLRPCAGVALLALVAAGSAQTFTTWGGNGHEYAVVMLSEGGTWEDAQNGATSLGGYLATPNSEAENEFVFSLIDQPQYWVPQGESWNFGPWMGLVQAPGAPEPNGGWGWITGETLSFTNWDPQSNEPNNNPPNEDRAHYHARGTGRQSYWNDLNGAFDLRPNSFVVERPSAVPEPASLVLLGSGFIALRRWRAKKAS